MADCGYSGTWQVIMYKPVTKPNLHQLCMNKKPCVAFCAVWMILLGL